VAHVRLDLDTDTFTRLVEAAVAERRPVDWQAEVILRRALGLPFPAQEPLSGSVETRAGSRYERDEGVPTNPVVGR
jgi:hypothetical protein